MRQVAFVVMIAAVALTALTAGCDNTPTQPSARSPSPVGTNRIDIGGPGTVAPGQSVQFTATAHRIDGTTADITSTANWRSLRPSVLTITPTGLATGGALGEANIQVTYQAVGDARNRRRASSNLSARRARGGKR